MNNKSESIKRWYKQNNHSKPLPCDYCGELCELAFTTGDCCDCFNEYSTMDGHDCPTCIQRQKEKQIRFEWLDKNTIRLSKFIRMD